MNMLDKKLPILLKADKLIKNKYYNIEQTNYSNTILFKDSSIEKIRLTVNRSTKYLNTIYTEMYNFAIKTYEGKTTKCTQVLSYDLISSKNRYEVIRVLWDNIKVGILEEKDEPFIYKLR